MTSILLIIGNGFSIDLYENLGLTIHPSAPFSFNIPDPFDNTKILLDTLTRVKRMIELHPGTNDFDIIQDFVRNYQQDNREHNWIHSELRQYLSLAYGYANYLIINKWRKDWRWDQWLKNHYGSLVGIVSFNYDLVLETELSKSFLEYFRLGSREEDNHIGIPIFKPHGSCDFDISNRAINMSPRIRLQNLTFLNNSVILGRGRVDVVPNEKLLEPRTESDIVLPFEISPQTKLTWVRQGYDTMKELSKMVDTCIICGMSYQPCDRMEIDILLDAIPPNINIYFIDPAPEEKLKAKLKTVSDKIRILDPNDFFTTII